MHKYLILSFLLIFVFACSDSKQTIIDIPITSDVEDLIEHSKEFDQQVLTFDTPGGKVHFAIGFGIANSIMVEGDEGNIIIDTSDSVFEAEKIYTLFRKKIQIP